jgi:hypothetical protein
VADARASGSGGPHTEHDLDVVASLLDGDLTGPERAAAVRQVAGCTACATFEADLRALVSATVALPTPARPRDFRLTAADAATLREPVTAATAAGLLAEPAAAATRLTPDMPDTAAHRTHDTLLVAALADRTIAESERQRAEDLVATCGVCASLLDDLVAIRTATVTLPTPPRVDDYQLTREDAARLHPGGWRRLVAAIGSSRAGFTRPLAVGLTTLGLAGLLVATVPSVLTGMTPLGPTAGAASAPQANGAAEDSSTGGAAGGGSAAGAPAPDAGVSAAATPRSVFAPRASGDQTEVRAAAPTSGAVTASGAGVAPVAASGAPVAPAAAASAATPAPAGSSAPGYNADLSSPQPTFGAAGPAATTQAPLAGSKGAGTGGDQGLAAPVANPLPTSKVAAESQTLDEERAAEGGPSALVLVSLALLVAGLGLLIVQRLGRRPIE